MNTTSPPDAIASFRLTVASMASNRGTHGRITSGGTGSSDVSLLSSLMRLESCFCVQTATPV